MRNGIQSSDLRLIDDTVHDTREAADPTHPTRVAWQGREDGQTGFSPILVLFTVSVACGTAAVAAGSYALWLTRQRSARRTLTDVQGILKVCQERMRQMEDDLNRFPSGLDPSGVRKSF